MPNYGQLANLAFTLTAGQPVAYVWELWDGQIYATLAPLCQKPHNRPQANVAVTAVDALGQYIRQTATLDVNDPPTLTGGTFGAPPSVLPFTVQLEVLADDPGQTAVSWRNAAGTELSTANPFTYQVTTEKATVWAHVYKVSDTSSYFDLELVLAGRLNGAPRPTPIAVGVQPTIWTKQLAPVSVATTVNHGLTGLSAVDGVTPIAGARVLVKNQTTASQNGLYLAASGAWSRTADALANGQVVKALSGSQAGRSYVLILDAPDGYTSGDSVIIERLASSYDGRNRANAVLVVDCAAVEGDGETLSLAKALLGSSGSGSGLAHRRVVSRTVIDTSALSLLGESSRLFDVQAVWTDSNGVPASATVKSAVKIVA